MGGRCERAWSESSGLAINVTAVTRVFYHLLVNGAGGRRVTSVSDHVEVLAELARVRIFHMSLSSVARRAPPSDLWLLRTEETLQCILEPIGETWGGAVEGRTNYP